MFVWVFLGRPGGMCGGLLCYRRFLPEGPPGGLQFLLLDLTRLSPARGWPYSIAPRIPPGRAMSNGLAAISYGLRDISYGLWAMDYGLWAIGHVRWSMGYGLCAMDHGLWSMGYGLWTMGYGLICLFIFAP